MNNKKRKAEQSIPIAEEQIWEIKEVKIKAKGKNRKRHSIVQRRNEKGKSKKEKRRKIDNCPVLFGVFVTAKCMPSYKVDSADKSFCP